MRRGRGSMPEVCQSHVRTRTVMPLWAKGLVFLVGLNLGW